MVEYPDLRALERRAVELERRVTEIDRMREQWKQLERRVAELEGSRDKWRLEGEDAIRRVEIVIEQFTAVCDKIVAGVNRVRG